MWEFVKRHSHEIMCWSWALGICLLLFVVMILIATNWDNGFKKGYEQGVKDALKNI